MTIITSLERARRAPAVLPRGGGQDVGEKHDVVSILPTPALAGLSVDAGGGGTEIPMLPEAVRRPRLTPG